MLGQIISKSIRARMYELRYGPKRKAMALAQGSKRLDLCAAQVAHMLHLSGFVSLKGKTCVEIGCGYVLSHSLIFHLLGATKVLATDISPIAQPSFLRVAIHEAVQSIVRDVLSPFCEHSEIRHRLNYLLSLKHVSFADLKNLGIEYIAPIDLTRERLNMVYDFVYSNSVLEHVPIGDLPSLLKILIRDLQSGGIMLHAVHLEDHKSIPNDPFDFLSESHDSFSKDNEKRRGNRMRKSQWRDLFNSLKELDHKFIYEWKRQDKHLPSFIDPSIIHEGEDDLRTSHIGIMAIKH
jgi:SAM-dependent methyltransferase